MLGLSPSMTKVAVFKFSDYTNVGKDRTSERYCPAGIFKVVVSKMESTATVRNFLKVEPSVKQSLTDGDGPSRYNPMAPHG